ncbi:MAG TPA: hypothetical protein VHH14_05380 [Solirubrobacterales bacterium]|nr:hypothetical protein [Solirubrobacterales bacterium]
MALLGDLLLIAGEKLEVPAEQLLRTVPLLGDDSALAAPFIAFEETDPPPSLAEQAAIYGAWIACNHPFPQYNREIGYRFMRAMLKEAEKPWPQFPEDAYVVEAMFESVETAAITVAEFVDWVCLRVKVAERLRDEAAS